MSPACLQHCKGAAHSRLLAVLEPLCSSAQAAFSFGRQCLRLASPTHWQSDTRHDPHHASILCVADRSCDGAEMSMTLAGFDPAYLNLPDSLVSPLSSRQPSHALAAHVAKAFAPSAPCQPQPFPFGRAGAFTAAENPTTQNSCSSDGDIRDSCGGAGWTMEAGARASAAFAGAGSTWAAPLPPPPPSEPTPAKAPAGLWSSLSQANIWGTDAASADEGWAALALPKLARSVEHQEFPGWNNPMPWGE